MPGGIIGEADIVVGADATGLASDLQKQAQKQLAKAGQQLGRELAVSVQKGARAAAGIIPQAITSQLGRIPQAAQQAAAKVSTAFSSATSTVRGQVTKLGTDARAAFDGAVAAAQRLPGPLGAFANQAVIAFSKAKAGLGSFTSGWKSSQAGLSALSGKMGTLGTAARAAATLAGNAIRQGIGGAASATFTAVEKVASKAWSAVAKGAQAAASTTAQALKVGIGGAAKTAGALIATGVGASLAKGFKRLNDLDQAQARLNGLGITAKQTASIMKSVDAAVTGTAFSAADAAKAAGVLATSGVKAGTQMSGALDAVVASAAASGREIGDITPIFAKVAAAGKLTGDTMQQMLENGINVSGALQKSLGKNADEIAKMVSSGEISFSEFTNALNGDLGLLAAAMGGTLAGMTKNVGAAMSRIGAAVQKPIFDGLLVAMPSVLDFMKRLSAAVTEFMEPLEGKLAPLAERVGGILDNISFDSGGIGSFVSALAPLIPLLGAVAGMAGGALSGLPVIGGMFSGLTGPIGLALGAIAAFTAVDPSTMAAGFESLLGIIPGLVTKLVGGISTVLPQIASNLAGNIGVLAQALVTGIPLLIQAGIQLAMALGQGLVDALPQLVTAAVSGISTLVTGLVAALPQLISAGVKLVLALVTGLLQALPQLISTLLGAIPDIISALVSALPDIIDGGIQLFLGLLDALATALPQVITALIDAIPDIIDALVGAIPDLIDGAIQLFLGIIDGLSQSIPQIITAIIGAIPQLIQALVGALPQLIQGAVQLFLGVVTGIAQALPKIVTAVIEMIPEILSALADAIPQLAQAGMDLIGGLVQGLGDAAGTITDKLLEIANGAINAFKDFFGINSPSKLMASYGVFLMQGLGLGIVAGGEQVKKSLTDQAKDIASRIQSYARDVLEAQVKLQNLRKTDTKGMSAAEKKLHAMDVAEARKALTALKKMDRERLQSKLNALDNRILTKAIKDQAKADTAASKAARAAAKKLVREDDAKALAARLKVELKTVEASYEAQRAVVQAELEKQKQLYSNMLADMQRIQEGVVALGSVAGKRSSTSMIRNLQKQIGSTQEFTKLISQLEGLGLDATTIRQLTDEFVQTGSAASAKALLRGGEAAIKEVADLQGKLATAGGTLGKTSTEAMYDVGVASVEGLIKGLESKDAALVAAAEKMAKTIEAAIEKALQIKSPSRVTERLGDFTVDGFIAPILGRAREVSEAMRAMASPKSLERVQGGAQATEGSGGSQTVINIAAGAIVVNGAGDPAEVAREVMDQLAELVELGGG